MPQREFDITIGKTGEVEPHIKGYKGPILEAPRLMLHAAELGFVHPSTEREMRWTQPMPDDMAEVLARLRG